MFELVRNILALRWLWIAVVVVAVAVGWYLTQRLAEPKLPDWIASGNGRIEAVAIDISARTGGRVREIVVEEGQTVARGEALAHMDTLQLDAQMREARAQLQRGRIARDVAASGVTQAEAEHSAALAVVAQRQTELESAERRLNRSEQLARTNAISQQTLDDDCQRRSKTRPLGGAKVGHLAAHSGNVGRA